MENTLQLHFGLSFQCIFRYLKITLSVLSLEDVFFMSLGLLFVVGLNNVWKQSYNYVSFLFVIVTHISLRHHYHIYMMNVVMFS